MRNIIPIGISCSRSRSRYRSRSHSRSHRHSSGPVSLVGQTQMIGRHFAGRKKRPASARKREPTANAQAKEAKEVSAFRLDWPRLYRWLHLVTQPSGRASRGLAPNRWPGALGVATRKKWLRALMQKIAMQNQIKNWYLTFNPTHLVGT